MLTLSFSLLLAVAHAQSSPVITAAPTLATSIDGEEPVSCTNHLLQYCPRAGFPYYANHEVGDAEDLNPYQIQEYGNYSAGETDASFSCQSKYFTAFSEYYNTAPITAGEVVPASTQQIGYTSTGTFTSWRTDYISVGTKWESYTSASIISDGSPGQTTETQTYIVSGGIQSVTTITESLSIISFPEASLSPTYEPWTTVTNPSQSQEVIAAYTPYTYLKNFEYTAVRGEGCCNKCSLFGSNVQVYYWPTPAPTGAAKTLVNNDNFTFVYPTLYLGLQSLYATDLCGTLTPQVVASTTIAIPEDNLSTAIAYRYNTSQYSNNAPSIFPLYTKADFAAQQTTACADTTTAVYIAGYSPGFDSTSVSGDSLYTLTYNPCSATLSVPTELFAINSAWATCVPGINGLYDPPYSLTPGNGLTAFGPAPTDTTTAVLETSAVDPTTSPEPVSTPTTPTPIPTTTKIPIDPTTSTAPIQDPSPSPPLETFSASTQAVGVDPATTPTTASPEVASTPALGDPGQTIPGDPTQTVPAQGTSPIIPTISFIIGSQTLAPGGAAITVSGTVLSLPTDAGASSIVVDGSTQPVGAFFSSEAAPEFIIGGSQTLKQGAAPITVAGTVVSLLAGGSSIVISNSVTVPLSEFLGTSTTTVNGGLGGVIETLGGFSSTTASPGSGSGSGSNTTYIGVNAGEKGVGKPVLIWGAVLGGGLLGVWWM